MPACAARSTSRASCAAATSRPRRASPSPSWPRSRVADRIEKGNAELARAVGRPRTVLEVGRSGGDGGEIARGKSADVVRIENAEASGPLGERRFDLVVLGDALEHTRDPLDALNRL